MGNCYSRQFWAQRTIVNRAAACAGSLPGLRTIARPQYPPPPIFPPPIPPPDVDWWDVEEEVGCDVIFAYDANAASYTASKVNLANPGTYNLTTGGAPIPDWNPERWLFIEKSNSVNQAVFLTGYTRPELNFNWTIAVRARAIRCSYCGEGPDCGASPVFFNASDWTIVLTCFQACVGGQPPTSLGWNNFVSYSPAGFPLMPTPESWHVYVISGRNLYVDGWQVGTLTSAPGSYDSLDPRWSSVFQIGGKWFANSPNNAIGGSNEISKVIAIDCLLDSGQVLMLTERMGAIVADPILSADTAYVTITGTDTALIVEGGGEWWNVSDVVFAYDSVAANYGASLVNLPNPGTYDMFLFNSAPDWASGYWEFTGGADILRTGYSRQALNENWTIAVRAKKIADATTYAILACHSDGDLMMMISTATGGSDRKFRGYNFLDTEGQTADKDATFALSWHVYVFAGKDLYVDGAYVGSGAGSTYHGTADWPDVIREVYFGNWKSYGVIMGGTNQINKAIGIERVLTAGEIATLSTAMAA